MDEIVRRRIRGRQLCVPYGRSGVARANWAEMYKKHPVGYKHSSLARIPKSHFSSRAMQDFIQDMMVRQIARTPAGPQRDFLIRDYEIWLQNGRPTANAQDPKASKPMELRKTWQDGKPLSADLTDMDDVVARERAKRLLALENS